MTAVLTQPFSKSRVHPVNHFTWYSSAGAWAGELLGAASVGITVGAQGEAGAEGSMDLAAPSFQCCGPGAFLCRPFVSFLFFSHRRVADKISCYCST